MPAGEIVNTEDACKWASNTEWFDAARRCGGFFDLDFWEKMGFNCDGLRKKGIKGVWIREGIKDNRPEILIHTVTSDSNISEFNIYKSGETSKPPGE